MHDGQASASTVNSPRSCNRLGGIASRSPACGQPLSKLLREPTHRRLVEMMQPLQSGG